MTAPLRLSGSASVGGVQIFRGLDLTLAPGTWTCLLGASGVGKSTVLRLFAKLGEGISLQGHMTDPGPVALMAQDDLLLPWLTALDNVLIGARLRGEGPDRARAPARARAREGLARVGLTEHMDKKPGALSGGQRQRVALARTLMEARPLVLLDEPFSALDALTRSRMQELTAEVLEDRTVLLVTHDPGEAARLGQAILIMTRTGLREVPAPPGPIPRPVDDIAVLQTQATLLQQLRTSA